MLSRSEQPFAPLCWAVLPPEHDVLELFQVALVAFIAKTGVATKIQLHDGVDKLRVFVPCLTCVFC